MSLRSLFLIYVTGSIISLYIALAIALQNNFLGVNFLVTEGVCVALISFVVGYLRSKILFLVMLVGFIIATIFDPFGWYGFSVSHAYLLSIKINGMMVCINTTFYILGNAISKKFPLCHPTT